jgi:hypothetical protein
MSIQVTPGAGKEPAGFRTENQKDVVVGRNQAFDAANSSLVTMSIPQEGVGDFLQGVWDFVTWPFRALYNLFFGPSATPEPVKTNTETDDKLGADSLGAFFKKYKGAAFNGKKEKEYAKGFLETFNTMASEDQRAFRKMLWVSGGHQPKNAEGESFAERTLGKKQHTTADRTALSRANDMMNSRDKLKELANRFDEQGVDDAEMATIRGDYDKLPIHVRAWVEKLACIFYTGNIPPRTVIAGGPVGGVVVNSPAFTGLGNHAKAYALACRLLAEGNFELLPKAARDEMDGLLQVLRGLHGAGNLNFGSATASYSGAIKHEKAKNLLIKAVEALENCPGNGEKYMQNAARNAANAHVPFNPGRFAALVQALTQFDTPIFRSV